MTDKKFKTDINERQKLFRSAGIILFLGAIGLSVVRIIAYFLNKAFANGDDVTAEIVVECVFDLLVQVVTLLGACILVSKAHLQNDTEKFLEVSNFRKTNWKVCIIAVGVGLTAPILSMIVNAITLSIFIELGINPPASSTILPENFSIGVLLLYIFLIAVLPGVCEEFFNRGIVLTAMRSTFKEWQTILLGGLVFGLFHQYIFQFFYTAVFGMVLVFIVLKTKSIIPTIIIHFTNNFIAVIGDFASFYDWNFLSLSSIITSLSSSPILMILGLVLGVGVFAGLVYLLVIVDKYDKEKEILKKLNLNGKINFNAVTVDVIGGPLGDTTYYKPTLKDNFLWWSAFATSLACTLCSALWYAL